MRISFVTSSNEEAHESEEGNCVVKNKGKWFSNNVSIPHATSIKVYISPTHLSLEKKIQHCM